LLRIALMPYFGWPSDMTSYYSSLTWFANGFNPYTAQAGLYPPFTYLIPFVIFTIARWCGILPAYHYSEEAAQTGAITSMVSTNQVNPAFLILWKLPNLFFDVLAGMLIYQLVREMTNDKKKAKTAFIIWFFNPLTLIISYVHGSYDVIAAAFIILGVFLALKSNYFSAGVSFGLGILTKLSPVYIALPLAAMLAFRGLRDGSHTFKTNFTDFGRFSGGVLVPLLITMPMLISYFKLMFFGVAEETYIGGGSNQWFFAVYSKGAVWVNSHSDIIRNLSFIYPALAACIGVIFALFLKWPDTREKKNILLCSLLFGVFAYFFISSSVQPQYLLWIMPLAITVCGIRPGFYLPVILLSIAVPLFYFAIQGPAAPLFPLANYTRFVSPEWVSQSILHYMNLPGRYLPFLRQDILLVTGAVGFLAQLMIVSLVCYNLARRNLPYEK
jgi:hypothetical protein